MNDIYLIRARTGSLYFNYLVNAWSFESAERLYNDANISFEIVSIENLGIKMSQIIGKAY